MDEEEIDITEYLRPAIGSEIVTVTDDEESVWFMLSGGAAIEIYAESDGGFGIVYHERGAMH